jgi:putative intracellular protease/amidase
MPINTTSRDRAQVTSEALRLALLWDESYLWGIMALEALENCADECGGGVVTVDSGQVRDGILTGFDILFVPGGWASLKIKALGEAGVQKIRDFVHGGGRYVGFCGGAGLATGDGLALLGVKRKPTRWRVPSFSGPIKLVTTDHPIWREIRQAIRRNNDTGADVFHAWWPSQLEVESPGVTVLAAYGGALDDAFSSDLNVGDVQRYGSWAEFEKLYGINLDPARMTGDPAVVEGAFGRGRVLLSLIHFDTPGDEAGAAVLKNILRYMSRGERDFSPRMTQTDADKSDEDVLSASVRDIGGVSFETVIETTLETARGLQDEAAGIIALGERNFLWYRRNDMLLQWRRGVRGLEYSTLDVMTRELERRLGALRKTGAACNLQNSFPASFTADMYAAKKTFMSFSEKAKRLLFLEKTLMQCARITYDRCDDPEVQGLRDELFSQSKSHGGMFKELVSALDGLLLAVIRRDIMV